MEVVAVDRPVDHLEDLQEVQATLRELGGTSKRARRNPRRDGDPQEVGAHPEVVVVDRRPEAHQEEVAVPIIQGRRKDTRRGTLLDLNKLCLK